VSSGHEAATQRPEDVLIAWAEAFKAKNLDDMMSLYEADSIWVGEDGQSAAGLDAIREVFAAFLALDAIFTPLDISAVKADGLALLSSSWALRGSDVDGSPISIEGRTADVLRRQPDGRWLYVIDSPYGGHQ
jgi:uncharacterized protein (TIGR02246 family)